MERPLSTSSMASIVLRRLKNAMEEDPDGGWFDFLIPAVIILRVHDKGVEMDQFHTVNSNAKKHFYRLGTGLAQDKSPKG